MNLERVIVIVLDGVGIGDAPDAAQYNDVGSNSIANTSLAIGGLHLPNMGEIGLGNIVDIFNVPPRPVTHGAYGKMQPTSAGMDSISGHWELMGIYLKKPFPTYPDGFPDDLVAQFSQLIGRGVLGNRSVSGTDLINELGDEHMRTGKLILYTSADSVFQIAAHEETVPIEELYDICLKARDLLKGEHGLARVIARPFLGEKGNFWRTEHRRDFTLHPSSPTIMDQLLEAKKDVYAVGKIDELFGGRGMNHSKHAVKNVDNIHICLDFLLEDFSGLLFVNLVEFDMVYGHRNNPRGYADALEEFDSYIPEIRRRMKPTDIAMVVSDHGVDPTTPSTDHSREYIPLLVFGEPVRSNHNLGVRGTFADVGATIAEIFSLEPPNIGTSFLSDIVVK